MTISATSFRGCNRFSPLLICKFDACSRHSCRCTMQLLHSEVHCEEASKEHEHDRDWTEVGGPQPCSFTWSHKWSQCKAIARPLQGHAVNATDPSDVSLFPSLPMDWVISNNPKVICKFDACSRHSCRYAMQLLHFEAYQHAKCLHGHNMRKRRLCLEVIIGRCPIRCHTCHKCDMF